MDSCITLSDTRERLRHGAQALEHPTETEPSLQVFTRAEIQSRGLGMTLRAGVADSPFGHCMIAEAPRGICHLSFFDDGGREKAIAEMLAEWPLAELAWDEKRAAGLINGIFTAAPPSLPPKLCVQGTDFQLRVWRALLRVPMGALVSYGNLAAAAGNPQASRATGSAVGANPVSFLIPCHRVIRGSGTPGQFRWGAARKRAMLAWEILCPAVIGPQVADPES